MSNVRPLPVERCRGTFSDPVYVEPVRNHTELAHRITELRYWERYLGIKTPGAIEQTIRAWEIGE